MEAISSKIGCQKYGNLEAFGSNREYMQKRQCIAPYHQRNYNQVNESQADVWGRTI